MIDLDAIIIPIVKEVLQLFPTDYVLKREHGTYDPLAGTDAPATDETYPVIGTPPETYTSEELANASILGTDAKIYIEADFLPNGGNAAEINPSEWTIEFGNRTFRIVSLKPIFSGKKVCLLELQARA